MSLETDVQKEFNKAIIRRDRQSCVTCGIKQNLTASHFFSVGSTPNLRFHSYNVYTQCIDCHRKHETGTHYQYYDFMYCQNKENTDIVEKLKNKVCKLYESDLKQIKLLASRYEPNTATADNLEKINKIVEGGMKCL